MKNLFEFEKIFGHRQQRSDRTMNEGAMSLYCEVTTIPSKGNRQSKNKS